MITSDIHNAIKLFKEAPNTGIVAYIDNDKKTVFLHAYKNFIQHVMEMSEETSITFDEVKFLEHDIPYVYLRNFLLRYHYNYYHQLGYKILFPKPLVRYLCTIRYKKATDAYIVCLTSASNPGKHNELIGTTRDPIEALEIKELYNECKAPFCWYNYNTKFATFNERPVGNYSMRILKGLEK